MSGGDRGKGTQNLVAGFCAFALFGAVVLAFAVGNTLGVHSGRDQTTARDHYTRAKQDNLRACAGRQGGAAIECVTEAIEAAQDQSDSRQDLYAQQDMSKWAFWMLIATYATLAITALGVWLVKGTLDATLKAVEDTGEATKEMKRSNDIALIAQRPWISIEDITVVSMAWDGQELKAHVYCNFINCGNSPAILTSGGIGFAAFGDNTLSLEAPVQRALIVRQSGLIVGALPPRAKEEFAETVTKPLSAFKDEGPTTFRMLIVAVYKDRVDGPDYITAKTVHVRPPHAPGFVPTRPGSVNSLKNLRVLSSQMT